MDFWSKKSVKPSVAKSYTSSASSDYSTCSDNPKGNANSNILNLSTSTQSAILAGQPSSNTISEDTNYSINFLDQNLDLFNEDDSSYMDCTNNSNENDSTKYFPLKDFSETRKSVNSNDSLEDHTDLSTSKKNIESTSEVLTNLSPNIIRIQSERLVTIIEEKEITQTADSMILRASDQNTGVKLAEIVGRIKSAEKVDDSNKNSTKRVLFANEHDVLDNDEQVQPRNKSKFKKQQKASDPPCGRVGCFAGQKENTLDENRNNQQNTTESFVYWEKLCQTSGISTTRRSLSFSELNSISESCGGDDECSTSFKTLDETYLSSCSLESAGIKNIAKKKQCLRRSKSCDSLLKEVKHLPHILYDRFLKCLATEIENIRKQNIVCTCQRPNRQRLNKENKKKTSKSKEIEQGKNTKAEVKTKDAKSLSRISPLTVKINQNRLSPEVLKNPCRNNQKLSPKSQQKKSSTIHQDQNRLSPEVLNGPSYNSPRLSSKSPNKTSTTPSKRTGLYTWHKEIVSPVGEYIRGKRQSPFQSSPNKRKV